MDGCVLSTINWVHDSRYCSSPAPREHVPLPGRQAISEGEPWCAYSSCDHKMAGTCSASPKEHHPLRMTCCAAFSAQANERPLHKFTHVSEPERNSALGDPEIPSRAFGAIAVPRLVLHTRRLNFTKVVVGVGSRFDACVLVRGGVQRPDLDDSHLRCATAPHWKRDLRKPNTYKINSHHLARSWLFTCTPSTPT